jgi:ATP-dependent RNA helicase DeaD
VSEEIKSFDTLGISKYVLTAIHEMGFEEPTPVQRLAIPPALEGKDLIGQAQTGTGKTAAFMIPILDKLDPRKKEVQALVLLPTRELAIQVAEEAAKMGKYAGIRCLPVYGGQPIDRQMRGLRFGAQVVIGTPGRVKDHLERKTLKLDAVKIAVLDEADEMLDMGFLEDMEAILSQAPEARQTLLFSATMPPEIKRLAQRFLKSPLHVSASPDRLTVEQVTQLYYEVAERDKLEALCRILDVEAPKVAILFCRTKRQVDELSGALDARGYRSEGLHGDLSQRDRDRVMKAFKDGRVELLVATDVAARGLDISNVSHVFNYALPQSPEDYVHRIGRTGRAGKTGIAITFVTPREYHELHLIQRAANTRLKKASLPTREESLNKQRDAIKERIRKVLQLKSASSYEPLVMELLAETDAGSIAAAALKLAVEGLNSADKKPMDDFSAPKAAAGMTRLFISLGKENRVSPPEILKILGDNAQLKGKVGDIRIFDRFTFVEVPSEEAEHVIQSLHSKTIRGTRVNVSHARARR